MELHMQNHLSEQGNQSIDQMQAYLYRRVTQNRGIPRIWLEGKQPERAGFEPGARYSATVNRDRTMVVLSVMDAGQRIVSSKEKGGKRIPVIDLNSNEVLSVFEGFDVVRVILRRRRIFIVPGVVEIKRRERLERLSKALTEGEPISVGSISHGIGVLSNALHAGIEDEGLSTKLAFANDIREDLLDQSFDHNTVWGSDSLMLAAPMQELAADRWAMDRMPQVHVLEMGIPCSGASVAGRAKRGTECAEAHPEVGALVVPALQLIQAANPVAIVLENVVPYQSSASMWVLRHALRDMGYDVHETVLDAAEYNELEHRKRMCMVAVTRGMQFSFNEIEKPALANRKLGEILDVIAEDDPAWSSFDYLKRHQAKHAALGNGFQMQVFDSDSDHVGTITKGYAKIRSTDPKITHPSNPELLRQLTVGEHCRAKGVPEKLVAGMGKTLAHEGLGQAICYAPFRALGKLLAKTLKKPIDVVARSVVPDLLAAA